MTYVYISYDRRDRDYLFRLAKQFFRRGVAYRYDTESPTPERFDSVVRPLIDGSTAVVVIRSGAASNSPEITQVIEYATAIGKPCHDLDRTKLARSVEPPLVGPAHIDMPDDAFVAAMRAIAPAQAHPLLWWWGPWRHLPSTGPVTFDPEQARRTRIYLLTAMAVVGAICIVSAIAGLLHR